MSKRRYLRAAAPVLGVLVLQGLLALVYFFVERGRALPRQAPVTTASGSAPELHLLRADRSRLRLSELKGRHVLVHFWATWCPPCRAELPTLLALADAPSLRERLVVLAVSVDDDWSTVSAFFGGRIPAVVVRPADGRAHASFGGTRLPDTFLVSPEGTLQSRFEGARDWSRPELRGELIAAMDSAGRFQ